MYYWYIENNQIKILFDRFEFTEEKYNKLLAVIKPQYNLSIYDNNILVLNKTTHSYDSTIINKYEYINDKYYRITKLQLI
jgi:hypothetical protein